jgi:hypothetical protein
MAKSPHHFPHPGGHSAPAGAYFFACDCLAGTYRTLGGWVARWFGKKSNCYDLCVNMAHGALASTSVLVVGVGDHGMLCECGSVVGRDHPRAVWASLNAKCSLEHPSSVM